MTVSGAPPAFGLTDRPVLKLDATRTSIALRHSAIGWPSSLARVNEVNRSAPLGYGVCGGSAWTTSRSSTPFLNATASEPYWPRNPV